jgi:hypothetical protein
MRKVTAKDSLLRVVTASLAETDEYGKASPIYTSGECKRSRLCGQFYVDLGNGFCVICWDKGFGGR